MGVDATALVVLGGLSRSGMLKGDLLTLGRHNTFFKSYDLRKINRAFALKLSAKACEEIPRERFTENLFHALGVATCTSVDGSNYEGASFVHDLNTPFGAELAGKFDFIYDGGTSEHIYNVAEVQKNISLALKEGGYYFAACPSNGDAGHGFYQFSPEFYFRSLKELGFEILRLYLVASQFPAQWYAVQDPCEVGGRIEYFSAEPVNVFVIARKNHAVAFAESPQQSDYEMGNWKTQQDHLGGVQTLKARLLRFAKRTITQRWLWALNVLARRAFLAGAAVWPTSKGIRRVNVFDDLKLVRKEVELAQSVAPLASKERRMVAR